MSSTTTEAICRLHSLYDIEEALELLVEAAEQTPDDPSLPAAVAEYLQAALEKRDHVAAFSLTSNSSRTSRGRRFDG